MKYLLLFLFLLPSAYALEESVFSGTAVEFVPYKAGDDFLTVSIVGEDVSIDWGDNSYILENNSCEFEEHRTVCAENVLFSHYNISHPDRIMYKATVKITQQIADMEITFLLSKDDLEINEQATITPVIQNTGSKEAENVSINLTWTNADISSSECTIKGDSVYWHGEIEQSIKQQCPMILRAKTGKDIVVSAKVTYDNGKSFKTETGTQTVNVMPFPIEIETEHNESVEITDQIRLVFDLEAIEDTNMDEFVVLLPDGLEFVEAETANIQNPQKATFSRSFKKDDTQNMTFIIQPRALGELSFDWELHVLESGKQFMIEGDLNVTVDGNTPYVRSVQSAYGPGQEVRLLVVNPERIPVQWGTIKVDDIITGEGTFGSVPFNSHAEVRVPQNLPEGNHTVDVTLWYETVYGETREIETQVNFLVVGEFVEEEPVQQEEEKPAAEKEDSFIAEAASKIVGEKGNQVLFFGAFVLLVVVVILIFARKTRKSY